MSSENGRYVDFPNSWHNKPDPSLPFVKMADNSWRRISVIFTQETEISKEFGNHKPEIKIL